MKKLILSLGLMFAATFALTNCAKNDEPTDAPVLNGPKYELFAAPADTRTTNDGLSTKWAEKDSINVFHAAAGTTNYKDDADFDIADIATGRFKGTLSETLTEGAQYDWYLLYPYESFITTPDNKTGYLYIGGRSDKNQQQSGNNSMTHIAGANYCPMYAKATVTYPDPISVTMNHLASVIAVNVTNDDEDAITVTGISFTATEDIVGQFYINIAGETPTYTSATHTEATANLTVSDGTPLAKGESAKFYMLIKPFTAASGSTLSLSVKTDKGTHTKPLTLPSDVTFTAGKIKTLNIGFTAPNEKTIEWNLATQSAKQEDVSEEQILWNNDVASMTLDKNTSTQNANFYYAKGNPAQTRFYTNQKLTITPKDGYIIKRVEFTATSSTYATQLQKSTWTNASASTASSLVTITPTDGTVAMSAVINSTCRLTGVTVFYEEGVVTPTIIAENIADVPAAGVENATVNITLKGLGDATVNAAADGTVVTAASVEGNTLSYTVSANETFEAREGSITLSAEGATDVTIKVAQLAKEAVTLTLSTDAVELEATDEEIHEDITFTTDATDVKVIITEDADGSKELKDWLTAEIINGNKIQYMAEANTGAERVAYIVVTATLDGYSIKKVVKVTQKAAAGAGPSETWTYKFTSKIWADNETKNINGKDWSLAGDGKYWGYDATKGHQFGSGSSPYKSMTLTTDFGANYKVKTIKINTSGASKANAVVSISVGGVKLTPESKTLTTTATDYTFTADALLTGEIVISWTQTTTKAIYLKSITIN